MNLFARLPVIVLAAGKGTRAGITKALIPIAGRPWLSHQLTSLKRAGLTRILVVLGAASVEIRESVPELNDADFIVNPRPDDGPFSSLLHGIATALAPGDTGCFVLPVDTPCPDRLVWEAMARGLKPEISTVVPCSAEGGGHPVVLSAGFAKTLLRVPPNHPDARLDHQIEHLPLERCFRLRVDDARVRMNLNTAADFGALGSDAGALLR